MRKRFTLLLLFLSLPAAALDLGGLRPDEAAVYVRNLQTGEVIAEHRADVPVNPASTMKLVTAFAALRALGADFRWQTAFKSTAPLRPDGLLDGDLYWVGSGDPVFDQNGLLEMQAQLRDKGVRRIGGHLVLDRSVWPHTGSADGFDDDAHRAFATAPDPQMLAYKVAAVTPGYALGNASAPPALNPPLPDVLVDSRAVFTPSPAPCPDPSRFLRGRYAEGVITVEGRAPAACAGREIYVNMLGAAEFAGRSFAAHWRQNGGSLADGLMQGKIPPAARTLASRISKPLGEVLADMNKHSNNIIARTVFLTLGERFGGRDTQDPDAAVRVQFMLAGIDTAPLVLENGSGLSRRERVSARMMGEMLAAAYKSPFGRTFAATLPAAGGEGTLKNRFRHIGAPLRLKTGTLKDVRALAGYYAGGNGTPPLAVVVIINSPRAEKLLGELDRLTERLIFPPAPLSDGQTPK